MDVPRSYWISRATLLLPLFFVPMFAPMADEDKDQTKASDCLSHDSGAVEETPPEASAAHDGVTSTFVFEAFGRLPLAFVENRGLLDERVVFSARQQGLSAHFTRGSIVLQLLFRVPNPPSPRRARGPQGASKAQDKVEGANIYLTFERACPDVMIEGRDPLPGRYNLYLQVLELDLGASHGVSFTPGLELVIGF